MFVDASRTRPQPLRAVRAMGARFAIAAGLCTSPVAAASLSWQAGEACPTLADVRFAVERMLGMPLERARPARLVVAVSRGADSRFVATVRVFEPSLVPLAAANSERTLMADDCWTLAAAMEAVMVLAIGGEESAASNDPPSSSPLSSRTGADRGTAPPQAGQHVRPPKEAAPFVTAGDTAAHEEPHSGAVRRREKLPLFGISAWGAGNSGALPEPGVGVAVALSNRFKAFEVRAGFEFLPAQALSATTPEVELTGELDALILSAVVCAEPWDSGRLPGAVGVSVCTGWTSARWSGSSVSAASAWWAGPRAEVGFTWPLPELDIIRFGLRVGGVLPLTRPGVYLASDQGAGVAYRLPPVVGSMLAGFEVVLP